MARDMIVQAVYRGGRVTGRQATADEIAHLVAKVDFNKDRLHLRSLITIYDREASEIHALGYWHLLHNTWISSSVVAVDLSANAVRTRREKAYRLGMRDRPEREPKLRRHFVHALQTRGFNDVSVQ